MALSHGNLCAALLLLASGCIIHLPGTSEPTSASSEDAAKEEMWTPEGAEKKCMPRTSDILDKAEAALAASRNDDALDLARQGVQSLHDETPSCDGETLTRIESRAGLVLAEAHLAKGEPLEALIDLERGPQIDPSNGCRGQNGARSRRCDVLSEKLAAAFPYSFTRYPAFGAAPYDIVLDNDIVIETISVIDNHLELDHRPLLVVEAVPSKVMPAPGGGVILRVEGSDSSVGGTSYETVGTVRIGGDDYEVKRGTYSVTHFKKAFMMVHVPAEDAHLVKVGQRCTVLIDTKTWKRAGATWTARTARVATATP